MASSSDMARPAHRTAWLIIAAALLVAILFGTMLERGEAPAERPVTAEVQASAAAMRQGDKAAGQVPARSYHAEETSHQAGALGFWILFSLWAVLLAAGIAPRLLQAGRRMRVQELGRGELTLR